MKKFIKEALSEIHSVSWPTKKHAINISKVAIVFTLSCAVFIWVSDYIFAEAYKVWSSLNPKNIPVQMENMNHNMDQDTNPFEIELNTETWSIKIETWSSIENWIENSEAAETNTWENL